MVDVGDDMDPDNLERVTREAMDVEDRPSLVIVQSHIGYGSPKQDSTKAHGSPLGEDAIRETKEKYGWDPDKHFYVPDEALAHFRECCDRGKQLEEEWNEKYEAWKEANPDKGKLFESLESGESVTSMRGASLRIPSMKSGRK